MYIQLFLIIYKSECYVKNFEIDAAQTQNFVLKWKNIFAYTYAYRACEAGLRARSALQGVGPRSGQGAGPLVDNTSKITMSALAKSEMHS